MDQSDDDLAEILNIDGGNVLLLPSTIKKRHSQRKKFYHQPHNHILEMTNQLVTFVARYFHQ